MMNDPEYIKANRDSWNKRTEVHFTSEFYNVEEFLKGRSSLNPIELDLLGNIEGLSILHLQCHFGQDSISLSRMGASVTGVDLSDKAIEKARILSSESGTDTDFICCDVYDLPNHLERSFDIVFTSYGTIGWLPDLDRWASVISQFLKPGGKFIFAEFHPVVWMYDDDFKGLQYSYFNIEPIIEEESGTYTDREAEITSKCITWNHPISEVLTSLLNYGMGIRKFREYDYSPYPCFKNVVERNNGEFVIQDLAGKLPMVYALEAVKEKNG